MADTIRILKGNMELVIPEDQKDRYKKLGYSVIDDKGNILEEAQLQDVDSLQGRVAKLLKENEKLKKENQRLKTQLKTVTKTK